MRRERPSFFRLYYIIGRVKSVQSGKVTLAEKRSMKNDENFNEILKKSKFIIFPSFSLIIIVISMKSYDFLLPMMNFLSLIYQKCGRVIAGFKLIINASNAKFAVYISVGRIISKPKSLKN